jgi:hypothetical protein
MVLTASLFSLVATACDEGSPQPDEAADDAMDVGVDGETETDDGSLSDLPSDEPTSEPCDTSGSSRTCPDAAGTQFCDSIAGEQIWGECLSGFECTPGDSVECFPGDETFEGLNKDCLLTEGVPGWDEQACNTPLVLSFSAGAAIEMAASSAAFDIAGAGECLTTDWPVASNPWLAIDLDKNGAIDGGHELFGSGTLLGSGRHASNGFIALASLDSNGDGKISAADVRFDELLVWRDEDGDKLSLPYELGSLTEAGVHEIDLGHVVGDQCDVRGNCGRERSSFGFVGATGTRETGEVVDVHLACQ